MSTRTMAQYQAAILALEAARQKAQSTVDEVMKAAGAPAAFLDGEGWQKVILVNEGQFMDESTSIPTYPHLDVTGWPMVKELVSAVNAWHTARVVFGNAYQVLPPDERKQVPRLHFPT